MFNLEKLYKVRNTVLFVAATSVCISAPASAQTQEQLSTCKAAVVGLANCDRTILKREMLHIQITCSTNHTTLATNFKYNGKR